MDFRLLPSDGTEEKIRGCSNIPRWIRVGTHPWIQLGQDCRRSDAWTFDFYFEAAATIHAGLVWNASMGPVRPELSEI